MRREFSTIFLRGERGEGGFEEPFEILTSTSSSAHRKRRIPSLVDETQDTRLVRVSGKISRKEYTFSHGWKKKNLTRIYSLFVPEMSCCSLAAGSCRNDCSKVCIYIYTRFHFYSLAFLANDTW